jgi:outer membrane protein assembly factor BamB
MKVRTIYLIIILYFSLICHLQAQIPTISWWYDVQDFAAGQSAAADIDGDGKLEVVFGCYRNDRHIYALNAEDGTLLWKYDASGPGGHGCNDVAPLIFDIDNDGLLEVIVPSSCNPKTFCFNGADGSLKWVCPTRGSDSPPTIADLDQDGKMEILHGQFGGYVICINAEDGTVKWEILVDPNSWIQTAPTIVDLDLDGQLDFVVASWNFNFKDSIFAFRGSDQSRLWAFPVHNHMYHGFAVADLDEDGAPEILIGSYNDSLYCLNGADGTLKWGYRGSGYIGAPVSVGDIDGDGKCEVVFVHASTVSALSNEGLLKWEYNIPDFGQAFRGVVLADINNDPYLDIIFGTSRGDLIALNGYDGSPIFILDLAAHHGNPLFELNHAPLVADFDQDGLLDIFIVGGYGRYPDLSANIGRAYMVSVGQGNGPDWLMFQRDVLRQSSLCEEINTSISTPFANFGIDVFPNPTREELFIQSSESGAVMRSLHIYNTYGIPVYRQDNLDMSEIKLDLKDWKSGVYIYHLSLKDGRHESGKFVLAR